MRPHVFQNIVAQAEGARPTPQSLYVVLTEACNLACMSCHVSSPAFHPPKDRLDAATVARVVREAAELGVKDLYVVGGEPLLRVEPFMAAARTAKAHGLVTETTTNGTRFTPAIIDELTALGFDEIALSLDGPTAALNDVLRSKVGVYQSIVATCEQFAAAKARAGRGVGDAPVLKFNVTLSNRNVGHIRQFIELAHELSVARVVFQTLGNLSESYESLRLSAEEQLRLRADALDAYDRACALHVGTNLLAVASPGVHAYAAQYQRFLADMTAEVGEGLFAAPCFMPFYHLVVDNEGMVQTCWNHTNPLRESVFEKSLADVFYGAHFEAARRAFLAREIPDFCANCCFEHVVSTAWLRLVGLRETGRHVDALAVLRGIHAREDLAAAMVGDARFAHAEAVAWEKHGDRERALDAVARGLRYVEGGALRAGLLDTRASVLARDARFAEAAASASEAVAIEPQRIESRMILAYARYHLHDDHGALAALEPIRETLPEAAAFAAGLAQRGSLRAQRGGDEREAVAGGARLAPRRVQNVTVSFDFVREGDEGLFAVGESG